VQNGHYFVMFTDEALLIYSLARPKIIRTMVQSIDLGPSCLKSLGRALAVASAFPETDTPRDVLVV
jgi:hypothetical protein